MKARTVILMPSVERNALGVEELLARQDLYCSKLEEFQGENFEKPLVILSGAEAPASNFKHIEICVVTKKSISILHFIFLARKVLHQRSIVVNSYIAGTPYQPFLAALLLKNLYFSAPIHTTVHGEISSLKNGGLSELLKLQFLKVFIRKADSVRFVSQKQLIDAEAILPIGQLRTFVAPVPILNTKQHERSKDLRTIAFVGRLQSERGINEWIEIAREFDQTDLIIVGDGPLMSQLKLELPNAIFLGSLKNSEVQEVWSKVGVFLSAAPFESYGLAMREALLHNVPVVSRRNAGSTELKDHYPGLVELFDNKEEAVKKITITLSRKDLQSEFLKFRSDFFHTQNETLDALARTWSNEF
jgi:glycosyltransferase involved in cell wall biosynthesis